MKTNLSKKVRFAKGTAKSSEGYFATQQIFLDPQTIDERELEKNCHFTENQFAAACRDNISCEICVKDLIANFTTLHQQLLNSKEIILFLSSDLMQYRANCEIHHQNQHKIRKLDGNNISSFMGIDQCRYWMIDFPKYIKEIGSEISISVEIFKAKINYFLKQQKVDQQFLTEKDILKEIEDFILPSDFHEFIQVRDKLVIINYNVNYLSIFISIIFLSKFQNRIQVYYIFKLKLISRLIFLQLQVLSQWNKY